MSSSEDSARPSQVTAAGWGIAIASLLLLFSIFDAVANLRSVDLRDRITEALTTGSAKGLGLSVEDAIEIMRWSLFVAGFAAVAAGILGVFVLQRNRSARIGLTVAAVPIVLTAPFAGGFLAMLIAACTTILWTRPARDWFAGRPPAAPEPRPEPPTRQEPAPPTVDVSVSTPPEGSQPPPTIGWGQSPAGSQSAPEAGPAGPNPYGYYPPATPQPVLGRVPADRPVQVRIAAILTWVFTGITALGYLAVLAAVTIDSDGLLRILQDSPGWDDSFDEDLVITAAVVGSIIFLVWSVAAATLAFFVWRRMRWAWILMLVSTGAAGVFSVVAFPFSLLHLIAIAVTFGALLSRPARDWFAR